MKKFLILTLLMALVVIPLASNVTAQEEVTLTFLGGNWWFDPEGISGVGGSNGYPMMQQYMEMHPEITFDIQGVPFPELDNTQFAALEAGQGPDFLIVNSVTVGAFIDRGYLMPMDEFIEASGLDTGVFYPGLFAAGVIQGQTFALPIDTGTRVLFWNKALFADKGIDPPTRWDQLIDVATQMTDQENGIYGLVASAGERWVWLYEAAGMYSTANGLDFVNDEATECVLDQGDNPQIIQFWVDMHNAGVMPEEDLMIGTGNERYLQFGNNKAAMILAGFWGAPVLEADYGMVYPDDYGILLLEGSAGTGSSTGGWLFAISRDAQHPKEAMDFMAWVMSTPDNLAYFTNLMPSTPAANELTLLDEFFDPFKEVLASPNTKHPIALNPGLPEQAEILRNVSQSAFLGEMTAQEAAESFCEQIEGTLYEE
jgi:ABC-type glycerol-3-phosphate transport system substrate-binding protein